MAAAGFMRGGVIAGGEAAVREEGEAIVTCGAVTHRRGEDETVSTVGGAVEAAQGGRWLEGGVSRGSRVHDKNVVEEVGGGEAGQAVAIGAN